ncbi:hypothetical protein AOLI_G00135080 [Acnodon oligacanthus]
MRLINVANAITFLAAFRSRLRKQVAMRPVTGRGLQPLAIHRNPQAPAAKAGGQPEENMCCCYRANWSLSLLRLKFTQGAERKLQQETGT